MCPRSTPVMCLQCSSAAEMPLLLRRVIEQGRFIFLLFDAPGSMVLLCQVSKKPVKPRAFIHEQQDMELYDIYVDDGFAEIIWRQAITLRKSFPFWACVLLP